MDSPDVPQTSTPQKRPRWVKPFLLALAETGVVSSAAGAAKVDRTRPYQLRWEDPEFAAAWDSAVEIAADKLEREAVRRAREGLVRYKFLKDGSPILDPRTQEPYYELEYSDTLLIFLLKGLRPGKYRDNIRHEHAGDQENPLRHEHTGKDGAPITFDFESLKKLPPDELIRLHCETLGSPPESGR